MELDSGNLSFRFYNTHSVFPPSFTKSIMIWLTLSMNSRSGFPPLCVCAYMCPCKYVYKYKHVLCACVYVHVMCMCCVCMCLSCACVGRHVYIHKHLLWECVYVHATSIYVYIYLCGWTWPHTCACACVYMSESWAGLGNEARRSGTTPLDITIAVIHVTLLKTYLYAPTSRRCHNGLTWDRTTRES